MGESMASYRLMQWRHFEVMLSIHNIHWIWKYTECEVNCWPIRRILLSPYSHACTSSSQTEFIFVLCDNVLHCLPSIVSIRIVAICIVTIHIVLHTTIGVDFWGGQPGHVPPNNWETFITFYHLLPPQYFGLPTQYFWQVYASAHHHSEIGDGLILLIFEHN